MCWRLIRLVIILICHIYFIQGECPSNRQKVLNNEEQLHEDLFCAYVKAYPPVKDRGNNVKVVVQFTIKYVSFDSSEEMLSVQSYVSFIWQNEFLLWDPSNYDGIKEIIVKSSEIWTPRMALINSQTTEMDTDQLDTSCLVSFNGSTVCKQHMTHIAMCSTWLRNWPYDKHNCTLIFSSWINTKEVYFTFSNSSDIFLDKYENALGWKIQDVYGILDQDSLRYKFILKRESEGLAAIIVIPFIVLVMIMLISLPLDSNDDTRLVLQCFSVFGHFMFLAEISYTIPKHSSDTPLILLFIRDSMLVVFSSILITLVLSSMKLRTELMPKLLLTICHFMNRGPFMYNFNNSVNTTMDKSDEEQSQNTSNWIILANIFNNLFIIIFVLVYVVILGIYFTAK